MDIAAMKAYGREARIFAERMKAPDQASEQCFVSNPSQEREGMLCALIRDACDLNIPQSDCSWDRLFDTYRRER